MTITYTAEVATCHKFGCFLKLLARWRGSIYKLVWMDLIVFLSAYYGLNFLYRFHLDTDGRKVFESVVHYCNSYGSLIPLSFVLGFYVSVVMERWWSQYMTIPWPDTIAVFISAHVHGQDERGRVMRRTVMRYVCLCQTIVLKIISPRVRKRFPTNSHLVDAGLLLENEREVLEGISQAFPGHPMHWMPIVWAASIITRARKESRIRDDFSVKTIIDELNKFRGQCGVLMYYNSISVPLVYTQVVTLAVYSYFLCNVIGQQWTEREDDEGFRNFIDKYFPLFTTLQFFFYMGWLKVAESLINPFGEDDDDFEVNWMIDRNLQVSYLIVDEMHHDHPELVKDQYWDEVFPNELPYANDQEREQPPQASTARLDFVKSLTEMLSSIKVDDGLDSPLRSSEEMADSILDTTLRQLIGSDATGGQRTVSRVSSSDDDEAWSVQPPSVSETEATSRAASARPSGIVRIADEAIADAEQRQRERSLAESRVGSRVGSRGGSVELFRDHGSMATTTDGDGQDDFDRLKAERERERHERQKHKYMLNVGQAANLNLEGEQALHFNRPMPSVSRAPSADVASVSLHARTTQTSLQEVEHQEETATTSTPPPAPEAAPESTATATDEAEPQPKPPPPDESAKDEAD